LKVGICESVPHCHSECSWQNLKFLIYVIFDERNEESIQLEMTRQSIENVADVSGAMDSTQYLLIEA
jgi:hypothetical protein